MAKKKKARAKKSHVPQVNNQSPAPKTTGSENAQYRLKPGVIRLAAIAVVIVLLLLLFAFVFANRGNNQGQIAANDQGNANTSNSSQTTSTITPTPLPSTTVVAQNNDDKDGNSKGDINGTGISTDGQSTVAESAQIKAEADAAQIDKTGKWSATDYINGEITKGKYEVSRGDTLWEIAEAVYGNGAQWTKILNANKSSIGFLKNHQQALIRPGQVLVIP